jgi:hypothetical protein
MMYRTGRLHTVGAAAGPGEWAALEEPGPHFRPSGDSEVLLPFRLHAGTVDELLDRLPPLVAPPRFDARHVRAAEPGALLSLMLLAGVHGVAVPAVPIPPRALIPPVAIGGTLGAASLLEQVADVAECLERMGWAEADSQAFTEIVHELSRNALEHSGAQAWVAAWQTGPDELRLAVADSGPGFAGPLGLHEEEHALREALRGRSRSGEPGRGKGLRRVAHAVARWGGRLRVRSRTVEFAGAPPWRDAVLRTHLPYLPGVQVEAVIPVRATGPGRG